MDLKFACPILLVAMVGCQKLKSEVAAIPEYPDLQEMYLDQVNRLAAFQFQKEVILDGKKEVKIMVMDSSSWKKELSFFHEINPNQPEYVGSFSKGTVDRQISYVLKKGENGILKKLDLIGNEDNYNALFAIIHEDKNIYVHHREIEVRLEKGLISSFKIKGYQKMILKDTIRFGITGTVQQPSLPN